MIAAPVPLSVRQGVGKATMALVGGGDAAADDLASRPSMTAAVRWGPPRTTTDVVCGLPTGPVDNQKQGMTSAFASREGGI